MFTILQIELKHVLLGLPAIAELLVRSRLILFIFIIGFDKTALQWHCWPGWRQHGEPAGCHSRAWHSVQWTRNWRKLCTRTALGVQWTWYWILAEMQTIFSTTTCQYLLPWHDGTERPMAASLFEATAWKVNNEQTSQLDTCHCISRCICQEVPKCQHWRGLQKVYNDYVGHTEKTHWTAVIGLLTAPKNRRVVCCLLSVCILSSSVLLILLFLKAVLKSQYNCQSCVSYMQKGNNAAQAGCHWQDIKLDLS